MQTKKHKMYYWKLKKTGLTLMEVLIAIFVFGIWILGVLKIMTQNIWLIDRAKLISTATLLSKEGMELAYNHRDTNVLLSYNWECEERDWNIDNINGCTNTLSSWNNSYIILNSSTGWVHFESIMINENFLDNFEKSQLFAKTEQIGNSTIELLVHWESNLSWSNFARYITFENILSWQLLTQISNNLIKVTSTTLYQKWGLTWEVSLQSFIGKRE